MGDGVADRARGRADGAFAGAKRRMLAGCHQLAGDLRHFAEAEHRVAVPVARAHAVATKPDLFLQCKTHRLDDAAFELVLQAIRIDDETGIGRTPDAFDANVLLDLDLR